MERGVSVEMLLIGVALFVLCGIALAIFVSTMYHPPIPPAQQNAACVTNGINLEGHTRPAENARDASRYITINFHNKVLSPCLINGNLSFVYSSCHIGKQGNVLIQVNEDACNLVDIAVNKTR
jgi:hypothetical protein